MMKKGFCLDFKKSAWVACGDPESKMAAMAGSYAVLRRVKNQVLKLREPRVCSLRRIASDNESNGSPGHSFDIKLLDILVCPLSKKPLR